MPHKVFISYSLEDKLVADAACAALEAQHIPCWIAPRDLPTLQESHAAIREMMAHCQIVLLIYSATSIHSPDLRRELDWAMSLGKIIAPFRVADVPSYISLQLAHINTHWLDTLTPSLENNLAELCGTITHLLAQKDSSEPQQWRPHVQLEEVTAVSGVATEPVPPKIETERVIRDSTAIHFAPQFTQPVAEPVMQQTAVERVEPQIAHEPSQPTLLKPIAQPAHSWPSQPQALTTQSWSEFRTKAEEPVGRNRFWNSSRIMFTVLLCMAFAFMTFIFMRDSMLRSVRAKSPSSHTAQSPVAPYITPGQLTPTVVHYKQSSQINVDSKSAAPETSEKGPAVAKAKVEPSISGLSTHKTNDENVEHPSKTAPAYPGATAESKVARSDSGTGLTWTDAATGLMWTKQDSGESGDLSWNAAMEYCKDLHLEGHSDWRLPVLGELEEIFDPNSTIHSHCCGSNAKALHVKGRLQLTGWEWSSTPGDSEQTAVYLSFDNADEYTATIGSSSMLRALCVRKAK